MNSQIPHLKIEHFSSQIFWLFISFSILYLINSKITLPKIKLITSKRNKLIKDYNTKAATDNEEIEKLSRKYTMLSQQAEKKAEIILMECKRLIEENLHKTLLKLSKRLNYQTHEVEQKLTKHKQEVKEKHEVEINNLYKNLLKIINQ